MELDEFREGFQRRRAQAYAAFFTPVTDRFVAAMVAVAGKPGDSVLDLGCGTGSLTRALLAADYEVIAVDHAPAMAALTRQSTDAPVVVADALRLPFADKTFDTVAAAFLLPHLPDLMAGLTEVRRILRPQGRLVMTGWGGPAESPFTGLAGSLLQERAAAFERDALAEATRRTDRGYLRRAVEAIGFSTPEAEALEVMIDQASPMSWWNGMAGASSGFSDLLRAQPPQVQRTVRKEFLQAALGFVDQAGGLRVPATAHLLTAQAL